MKKSSRLKTANAVTKTMLVGGALMSTAGVVLADESMDDLKARVAQLEALAAKEGLLPSGKPATKLVSAMSDITISGFVQASYFYDTSQPDDRASDGYLWNTAYNEFSFNKLKLTIASKPVDTDKWDAGFRASLMFGEDAPDLNSGSGGANTGFEDVREAYVELNVPVGTGLNIKAGELISLLNWESGDGGAANPNFSQGNQWWYTGNGPSAGIQLGYNFTDKIGLTLRLDNGLYAGPTDSNDAKAFSAALALKPFKDFWITFVPFYSVNETTYSPGPPVVLNTDVSGIDVIGGYQVTEKLGTGFEFDYFHFNVTGGSDFDVWSLGGWVWYDFTSKVGIAFRADYVESPDVVLGPPVRPGAGIGSAGTTTDTDGALGSLTLTLNLKPMPNVKIQPEIRYDYTTYNNGLDNEDSRVIIGAGISYMF